MIAMPERCGVEKGPAGHDGESPDGIRPRPRSFVTSPLVLLFALILASGCGQSPNDPVIDTVAFTPIPTQTPLPKLCGNGVVNAETAEECEGDSDCGGGKSCICCVCLADGAPLGDRTFSVARPPSKFLSSGLNGGDVSSGTWLPGPLALRAGRPDPDAPGEEACSAPLSLTADVVLGFNQPLGVACTKFFAAGSSGTIDCDGGTAHDIDLVQDSNGTGENGEPVYSTGLGNPIEAGPGAATLRLARTISVNITCNPQSPSCNAPSICPGIDYENPGSTPNLSDVIEGPLVLTTRRATARVLEPRQGGDVLSFPVPVDGENFTCSTWSQEDAQGRLAGPVGALDALQGALDTVNVFLLEDRPQQ